MSYISHVDTTSLHAPIVVPSRAASGRRAAPRLNSALPVGPVLEAALFVATSSAVSLVMCTAAAGALLQ
jgi:hypothetical protein